MSYVDVCILKYAGHLGANHTIDIIRVMLISIHTIVRSSDSESAGCLIQTYTLNIQLMKQPMPAAIL